LLKIISHLRKVETFWYQLTQVHLEIMAIIMGRERKRQERQGEIYNIHILNSDNKLNVILQPQLPVPCEAG